MQAEALYSDFGSLARLRVEAREDASGSLREVASQFESLFVQMMLKSMRDAIPEGGLFDSHHMDNYQSMYDQQLAKDLSGHGGLGLADMLVEQLRGGMLDEAQPAPAGRTPADGMALPGVGARTPGSGSLDAYRDRPLPAMLPTPVEQRVRAAAQRDAEPAAEAVTTPRAAFSADSPQDFLRQLQPLAQRAARRLGVDPEVLLAQAALETGWGRHVAADASGSSNNLFNIKADGAWNGPSVTVSTLEYRDGVAQRESARFRAYASPAESFADYVRFIQDSPRYAVALASTGSPADYLHELQRAGYATDPAYADKVLAILERANADPPPALKTMAQVSLASHTQASP